MRKNPLLFLKSCRIIRKRKIDLPQNIFQKKLKKIAKKFGGLKKVRIFAARLRENSLSHGRKSSLKRLKESTRSKYRENTIYREALISFEIISVSDKLRIIYEIIQ